MQGRGIDKDKGEEDHRGQPQAAERFSGAALRPGPLVAAADFSRAWTLPARTRAIKSVFDGVNPQGCEVTSFKQPSTPRARVTTIMWRSMIALPERGRIGIFNRSYYEECLVVRVHPDNAGQGKDCRRNW